jgi:hypothetical protein
MQLMRHSMRGSCCQRLEVGACSNRLLLVFDQGSAADAQLMVAPLKLAAWSTCTEAGGRTNACCAGNVRARVQLWSNNGSRAQLNFCLRAWTSLVCVVAATGSHPLAVAGLLSCYVCVMHAAGWLACAMHHCPI